MKKITFFLVIATACYSDQHFVLPNMIPSIIIELVSSHVYQSMSETDKIRCAVISNYLEIQTRYFLIAHPKFSKAIENFATSATTYPNTKLIIITLNQCYLVNKIA